MVVYDHIREARQHEKCHLQPHKVIGDIMNIAKTEAELAERASRFLKAELKRADVTYEELAKRLRDLGLEETRDSVAAKLKRGTFAATFLLATLAALGREGMRLADLE
jgi:hypothetical protein